MEVEFSAEISLLEAALHDLAEATGKEYGQVVRANARLIAVNLAYQTQPFGDDDRGRIAGEIAVKRDLKKVYAPPGSIYSQLTAIAAHGAETGEKLARAFYAAIAKNDLVAARRIVRGSGIPDRGLDVQKFDGGAAHGRRRDGRGRVSGRHPEFIVADPKKLQRYRKTIIHNVGIAKSGWAAAARPLGGTRGIPQWVTRHKAHGSADDHSGSTNDPHVVLRNTVAWLASVLPDSQIRIALRLQAQKMEAHVDHVTNYLARKHLS